VAQNKLDPSTELMEICTE